MSEHVLTPGAVVAQTYEVEHLIGRGAMGEVYSAVHRRLPGLRVAIKVMTGQGLGEERLMRFRQEAEIAAKLSHPNIVQIIDYHALATGEPYLVMEFLRGESLHRRLRGGPMSLDALTRMVREVGSALDSAHRAGVVHRDLKPENIYLVPTPTGDQAKVLDFGISKMTEGALVRTTDSTIIGTPRYMSPEQAMGLNSQLTARSDLFSLATICYEALTGKPMFHSENVAHLLYQIVQVPHTPLLEVLPQLPQNIAHAIEHALVKEPEGRTPDAATFVRELTGQAVPKAAPSALPVRPPSSSTQGPTQDQRLKPLSVTQPLSSPAPRRSRVRVLAVGAVVLVLGGAASFVVTQRLRARALTPPIVIPPPTSASPAEARLTTVNEVASPAQVIREPVEGKRDGVKATPPSALPLTEVDHQFLGQMQSMYDQHDWASLVRAWKSVVALPTTSRARRTSLLMVFEAMCARRETTIIATFNRLVQDSPELRNQAIERCRRHAPDQAFERIVAPPSP